MLTMLTARSVVAEENGALSSRMFMTAEAGFSLDYSNDQMAERATEKRIIDRLRLLDSGQSTRYSVSLDLENEDGDWSFEVAVTMEF